MRFPRSVAVLLAACVVLLTLPGCPAFTNIAKAVGLMKTPKLELPMSMPADFELRIHVTDQADPPADYLLVFRRDGKCEYQVTTRAPRRRVNQSQFEIYENQVSALYQMLLNVGFDKLPPQHPATGEGKDRALGVQAFWVKANNLDHEVRAHFQAVPQLEKIRSLALSYLPPKAMADTGSGTVRRSGIGQVVGDVRSRLFYDPDDPMLKDVPPDARQPFPNHYDALNHGFAPAPGTSLNEEDE